MVRSQEKFHCNYIRRFCRRGLPGLELGIPNARENDVDHPNMQTFLPNKPPHVQFTVHLFTSSDMAAAERSITMKSSDDNKWAAFQQLFAGVSAGVATTICTHPLDLIKTRMQSTAPCPFHAEKLIRDS